MSRIHNFSAGPGILPEPVLQQARQALWDFDGSGLGLAEISHRSDAFRQVLSDARQRLHSLLQLTDDHEVLFLQGGAQTQFYQIPMNVLRGGRAVYLDTGTWSVKAAAEARRFGQIDEPFSSRAEGWDRVPQQGEWGKVPDDTVYLHYTSNNTVAGTEFHYTPQSAAPLVVDASSNILSRPWNGGEHAIIYAGAQKNMALAGVTLVVIRRDMLDRCDLELPTMLRYGVQVDKGSMYNTPPTFAIYILERVTAWIEAQGGLAAVAARNDAQAKQIYDAIDASALYRGKAERRSRSHMNITFTTNDPDLDTRFWKTAAEQGMSGLKGHRVVGGLRASIYNAQTDAAVDALVQFMGEFEAACGR